MTTSLVKTSSNLVIPAKAGIQLDIGASTLWVPAFARMKKGVMA